MNECNFAVHDIIWGLESIITDEVFQRWCQGFEFSDCEPSALKQYNGGPCAIIASVQAHMLRLLYFDNLFTEDKFDQYNLLIVALTDILKLINPNGVYRIAFVEDLPETGSTFSIFKSNLRFTELLQVGDLEGTLFSIQHVLMSKFGILCYLYSLVATYGVEELKNTISDDTNCLIDHFHGHASQCLTNLLITGRASPYLFDNETDLGGYVITGIVNQPKIGFLTIMEYLRYCEVGWNLKNPQYPIWILASETHLSVLCSKDKNIIEKDKNIYKKAINIFNNIDVNDQGFIMYDRLKQLLVDLSLPTDEENIAKIITATDPEKLGVLLKTNVLKYLYPNDFNIIESSYKFPLIFYNGLVGSNINREVRYVYGEATVEDFTVDSKEYNINDSLMLKCLRTKWPTISIQWDNFNGNPTLN